MRPAIALLAGVALVLLGLAVLSGRSGSAPGENHRTAARLHHLSARAPKPVMLWLGGLLSHTGTLTDHLSIAPGTYVAAWTLVRRPRSGPSRRARS